MITLTNANRTALERALERAQSEQINVYPGEVTLDGATYYADNSRHAGRYFVTIVPNGDGTFQTECTCDAGSPKEDYPPLVCKHLAACLEVYIAFLGRATKAGVITLCTCGNRIEADQQECDECIEARHEWQLEIEQEHAERPQAHGPYSAKNPPLCKYCGEGPLEVPGKEATALYSDENYQSYYSHQSCESKARKAAKKPCTCNRQSCSECNPVYCSNCGTSHKDNIAACPGCGYRYW